MLYDDAMEAIMLREMMILEGFTPDEFHVSYDRPFDQLWLIFTDLKGMHISGSMVRECLIDCVHL